MVGNGFRRVLLVWLMTWGWERVSLCIEQWCLLSLQSEIVVYFYTALCVRACAPAFWAGVECACLYDPKFKLSVSLDGSPAYVLRQGL